MRKAEVLLAYLALAPGLRHPRERLINLLWSDRSDEQARNSLRQCLSSIRKALGDAADLVLQVERSTVSLKSELIEIDAHEFERLALEGDFEALNTAASLYQGEFLEGISIRDPACQEWLESERSRFKRQYIELLSNLAETQLVTHDFKHAIRSAEKLIEQDPLVEFGWRLLMRSYYENGNRNHALKAYQRCEQILRQELDIAPEEETTGLRKQIAASTAGLPRDAVSSVAPASTATRESTDHSIAVLPFDNLSGDPEQEYFADGLTSDIIATLFKFKHLRTVAHYSMMLYKHQKSSITEIAEQQQVRYILEGSVRKSGEWIRVNAALIDSQTDEACWSERYDRDIDDLFGLQDEITHQIALAMKVQLDDGDMARLRSKGTSNVRAWEMVMTAVDLQDTYIHDNIHRAQALLRQATELDPNYAYAWVALGWTHVQEAFTGYYESIEQSMQAADSALERARAIDPDYTETLGLAGMIHMMRHEADGAVACCREAVAREPSNPEMHGFLSYALLFCGDYAEARIHNQKMIELCPIPANWYYMIGGQIECMTENLEVAAKLYRKGIDVEPQSPLCRFFLVDVLLRLGDENGANRLVEEIRALDYEMRSKGLVHSYSNDPALRDALRINLEKFDLY